MYYSLANLSQKEYYLERGDKIRISGTYKLILSQMLVFCMIFYIKVLPQMIMQFMIFNYPACPKNLGQSAKVGQNGTRFLVGGGGWRGGWLVVGSRGVVRPFIQKIIICH